MANVFSKSASFIKENLSIVYSLFLIVLIPAAFFINNYLTNSSYENNIDQITQRKAVMVENIINNLIKNQIDSTSTLQSAVDKIIQENSEIVSLSIIKAQSDQGGFDVIVSSDPKLVGQKQDGDIQNNLAWFQPEGIAFLDKNEEGRFWKVTKILSDSSDKKIGLIEISFSLADSDSLINKTISDSYFILILTILIVVLLVANQARLLGYAFTVTQLKEVDKMKDMFISMASHELRSPLTAIKGYLDLIKDQKDIALNKNASHYLENISLSAQRLDNLVEDILEVSRIEGNRLPIEIKVFDPNPVISQSIEEMRSQAMQKNLILNYLPFQGSVKISADEDKLKQVIVNLISNAVKYTKKGSVSVSTSIKNKDFLITVADTGIGISSEDRANLFQKFYRIKNESTRDIIGTGLGLWITLEIIKRMQGKITVESIKGVGSHFTVYLPVAKK